MKERGVKHFVVVYFVPEHEKGKLEEIRAEFMREAPFDLVVLTREELESLAEKLREWGVLVAYSGDHLRHIGI
ncbi:MAG: hypothetical protein LM562_07110 [Pyrobaculum sp.]|nr:hypothetical protein [Pyrobaculum sp.]